MSRLLWACGVAIIFISSCRTSSKVSKTPTAATGVKSPAVATLDSLRKHSFQFDWFSGKAKIEIDKDESQTEVNASIRMRNDSAIWISISAALGIEVARVLLTPDSIRVIDRINDEYYSKDYSFFRKYTALPVNFNEIQNLIEGNPLFLNDSYFGLMATDSSFQLAADDSLLNNSIILDKKFIYLYQSISDTSAGSFSVQLQQYDTQYNPAFSLWRKIELYKPARMDIVITFNKVTIGEPAKMPFKRNE